MHISTLDPISMQMVRDVHKAPFVIEGTGENSLKVFFENEHNRDKYLSLPFANGQLPPGHA